MVVGARTVVFTESTVRRSKSGRGCLTRRRAYVSCFVYGKAMRSAQQKSMWWRMRSMGVGDLRRRWSGPQVCPELPGRCVLISAKRTEV